MSRVDGSDTVALVCPSGALRAEFVPAANMVCRSLSHRGAELLYPGHGVDAYAREGTTMGIPLLYPWANRLAQRRYAVAGRAVELPDPAGRYPLDPAGLPIHGALPALLPWSVEDAAADRFTAVLDWNAPALLELFPFPHRVSLAAVLTDDQLMLVTTVTATGEVPVPVSFGYHPYLVVPGVPGPSGTSRSALRADLCSTSA